eukprot:TRINITY_DN18945_c0_g1_i1.p1 TRINITY_DN18945_c0_g1~~TRINITY_DN18945_c0_g1_i1.p1  ORF type:complete len:126 (-),score=1.99 TRINITY_DN18945_c0_g1_i1:104-481(-)
MTETERKCKCKQNLKQLPQTETQKKRGGGGFRTVSAQAVYNKLPKRDLICIGVPDDNAGFSLRPCEQVAFPLPTQKNLALYPSLACVMNRTVPGWSLLAYNRRIKPKQTINQKEREKEKEKKIKE